MNKGLTGLERNLATLIIGVDTLLGGDVMHESGTRHVIADTWFSDFSPPEIYSDPLAEHLRQNDGIETKSNYDLANQFIKKHNLSEIPQELKEQISSLNADRKAYLTHLVDALEMMLRTELAMANSGHLPKHEERYRAATLLDSILIDVSQAREQLRESLSALGYNVSSQNLRESLIRWKNNGVINKKEVEKEAKKEIAELDKKTKEVLFPELNCDKLSQLSVLGHRFKTVSGQKFTGSSAYHGKSKNGKPLFKALFEYNTDHPINRHELIHICSHEVIPGHYTNVSIMDLLWRDKKLGFEATVGTMCTPSVVLEEGWAQNGINVLFGSRESAIGLLGKDLGVVFAIEDLEDIAKHNGAIMYQRDGMELEKIKKYLAEDCVQTDPFVKKISGLWTQHPIFGAMYGPAYYIGSTVVRDSLQKYGLKKTARVALNLEGLVDIGTFKQKVSS